MNRWVVLLRGLPSEIAAAQSWLNANEIPTIVRTAVHESTVELLVPAEKLARAKELLSATGQSQSQCCGDEMRGDWDE